MLRVYLDTSVISAKFDERIPQIKSYTERFFSVIESFDVYISELVLAELERTRDKELKWKLTTFARSHKILIIDEKSDLLATQYVNYGAIPEAYREDAVHIAIATTNTMDYLLSWNFEHLVRVKTRSIVNMINSMQGFPSIEICTPPEII